MPNSGVELSAPAASRLIHPDLYPPHADVGRQGSPSDGDCPAPTIGAAKKSIPN
jgi:hypothetical protein